MSTYVDLCYNIIEYNICIGGDVVKKHITAIVAAAVIFSTNVGTAAYGTITAYGSEKSVEKMDKELDETLEKIKKIESQNKKTQQEINNIHAEIKKINAENEKLEKENKEIEKEIEALNKEKEEKYEIIRSVIKIEYEQKSGGYLSLLLEADSFKNFLMRAEVVSNLIKNNNYLVKEIEKIEGELNSKVEKLYKQIQTIKDQKAKAESEAKRLNDLVDSRTSEKKELLAIQNKLEKQIEKAKEELAASASGGTYSGGKMGWPVPSNSSISSHFGYRVHPVTGVNKLHDGIDIPAATGSAIVAANDGIVVRAEYNTAYGNWIVIDHGGGIMTYYAHNSSMLVSVGQRVKRGQQIAKAGSTGYSTGSHCHFSVLVNGSFVNPLNYLR